MQTTIADLETAAREYANTVKVLRNLNENLNSAVDKVKSDYLDKIRIAAANQKLLNLPQNAREIFKEKKTLTQMK